ncbi:MAG: adenosylcobinamide-phosphate synthase CbiB [Kyrpidia sp.]|nr:adenosylcobinamide-phosphate synthase CbiB [Kyrpidia sp.]
MVIATLAGLVLDVVFGEPPTRIHPVVGLGRLIEGGERWLRRLFRVPPAPDEPGDEAPEGGCVPAPGPVSTGPPLPGSPPAPGSSRGPQIRERTAGILLAAGVVGLTYAATWTSVCLAGKIHPVLAEAVSALWVWTAVAPRSLAATARRVSRALAAGDLPAARRAAGLMVSRGTDSLPEREVIRAAVESVAENIVDAVVSPLLYAAVGGGPAAMAYRAANTLDAMVGYRNPRYRDFGWGSAKFDDLLNWIPARLAGWALVGAAAFLGLNAGEAWRSIRRDAHRHPSPNGGVPEAAVAGALGVRLGGWNTYHGRRSFRPYLGPGARPLQAGDIARTVQLMIVATGEAACLIGVIGGIGRWW